MPSALQSSLVGVPSIPDPAAYAFSSPNQGVDATYSQAAALAATSHMPPGKPHLSFVNATARDALATLDRVELVAQFTPSVDYPETGFGLALQAIAGALVQQVGSHVFWVQTEGFDTQAGQGTMTGLYAGLMTTLDDGVQAFYADLVNQGLFDDTLVLQFSEFGRRVSENGSGGTDHGAAGLIMAVGGRVSGGLYGTAASLADTPDNRTLENEGRDVAHQTDFRSVLGFKGSSQRALASLSLGDFGVPPQVSSSRVSFVADC